MTQTGTDNIHNNPCYPCHPCSILFHMKRFVSIFSFLFLFIVVAHPQKKNIKNLVFEGAGIRGIAYGGAIEELENNKVLAGVEKVGGTSAGAITALCLSLGYSSSEITELLYTTNFKKLNDGRFFFPGGINRLNKYFGWYRGERMTRWIAGIIEEKTGNPDITFEELYNKGFKDLYITATVLNEQKMVVLSRLTYPKMHVKDAVRISASIPFYFEAVFVNSEGKIIPHPKKKQKDSLTVMVDGGLVGNFPIRMFDSVIINDNKLAYIPNENTIGFRVDRDKQIENDRYARGLAAMPVKNLKEYSAAFYNIVIENLNRQTLSDADWKRTISISDGNVAPRIRKLSIAEIDTLIGNGRTATKKFFRQ
jgi:NTE family protein